MGGRRTIEEATRERIIWKPGSRIYVMISW